MNSQANTRAPSRWVALAMLGGAFGALLWLERRRPLRGWRDPSRHRVARNVSVGLITAVAVMPLERVVAKALAKTVEQRGWGIVPRLPVGRATRSAVALLLMDYTLYLWHILLHRVPLLWRCHVAHHADLDLDVSTALRFHFGEFILSVPWRAAQIVLIGVSRPLLSLWGLLTLLEVMFHHSNLRLPLRVENVLCRLIATPRLHGIHHSIIDAQRQSNFSSGLTVWDFVHRTAKVDVPQQSIVIGLPEYRTVQQVTLDRTLLMPFEGSAATDVGTA